MEELFSYDGQLVKVTRKRMKNMYLRVQKPDGHVEISAPNRMARADIISFLAKNWEWVNKKQQAMRERPASPERRYVSGDRIPIWGQYLELVVRPATGNQAAIYQKEDRVLLYVPDYATREQRREIVNGWYRRMLEKAIPALLPRCEAIVGKRAAECRIRNMKTRWGTCNVLKARVWLNLQLAKYKPEALEYVMLHELTHLWEHNHGPAFKARMDQYCPDWRQVKHELNTNADFE
jgi:predicted metal-dependent hydrolase